MCNSVGTAQEHRAHVAAADNLLRSRTQELVHVRGVLLGIGLCRRRRGPAQVNPPLVPRRRVLVPHCPRRLGEPVESVGGVDQMEGDLKEEAALERAWSGGREVSVVGIGGGQGEEEC